MMIQQKVAAVFGGTGFIGRAIVRELAKAGYIVRVVSRSAASAYFLKPYGDVGQIVPFGYDPKKPHTIETAVTGADIVVYSVGVLFEKGKNTFQNLHVTLPCHIAAIAKQKGVKRFVLLSALGVEKMHSRYGRSKTEGETAVKAAFPEAIILRPSLVFGPEDDFFNKLARFTRLLPVIPLLRQGNTKFQPVYVDDVAKAALKALDHPSKVFELGGDEVLTFKQIYQRIFAYTGLHRPFINLPTSLAMVKAFFYELLLPTPFFTRDQLATLKTDSVLQNGADGLETLNIPKTTLEAVLPAYLAQYKPGGPFAKVI